MHFVVIGNGVAGINAANNIRISDKNSKITIISKESKHFFSRTALMYVLSGQLSSEDIEPFERDHYKRMNFNRIHDEVIEINPQNKILKFKNENDLSYDRLLIASGSVPNMIGWKGQELDGVCNFVTWQNLQEIQDKSRTAKKACIVGGGLIGIEVAEALLSLGIKVTFLIREDYFWPIALDINEATVVTNHMKHHGCEVLLQTECKEVLGQDGRVVGLLTNKDETLDCDIVVFTIGVKPQTNWLENCGIELDNFGGIIVDDHLTTNLSDIYAAGDCTSVVWFNGVRRPEQLWYTSRDQGKIAGLNMTGNKQIYKRSTFYNSAKFFNLEYTTAGYVNFNFDGENNWYQNEPGTDYTERITYLPDNSVIGFNMIGRRWDHRLLVKWIDEKRTLEYVLKHLHEALFDEEFMSSFKISEQLPKV